MLEELKKHLLAVRRERESNLVPSPTFAGNSVRLETAPKCPAAACRAVRVQSSDFTA